MFINLLIAGNNHNLLQLNGLKNGSDGQFVNNATVTVECRDQAGALLSGMNWPANLAYSTGTNGCYQLLLDSALNLTEGQFYQIKVTADAGGLLGHWKKSIKAKARS